MAGQGVAVALKKELRALVPAWLAFLALFAPASLMGPASHDITIGVSFLGAIALGALSIGHEYNDRTLSLLLSQPRRRPDIVLLKLSALAPVLLTLAALTFALGNGSMAERRVLFMAPLLCGLFIAPWFTMLCRSALAGIVFTAAIPGVLLLAGQIAAALKFGTDPEAATASVALQTAVMLWGMLAVSTVAAVCGWRLFMRLEAIDGRGHAIQLPWQLAGAAETGAVPLFTRRRASWLLVKKELRLQQLTFVAVGLYVVGWFAILAAKGAMPYAHTSLLFALSGLNAFAVAVLAGSLASAEERQLGTLEWHALLPAAARAQWAVKAGVTVGVAVVLGLATPMALASLAGSIEVQDAMRPLLSAGTAFALIFLAVSSLYVSSLSANSLQALLCSIATGFGLLFLYSWSGSGDFRQGLDPFEQLRWQWQLWRFWLAEPPSWPFVLLMAMTALAIAMFVGGLGLLLRFARANHRSAERSARSASRQLLSVVAFVAILMTLWFAVADRFRVEADAYSDKITRRTYGFVTVGAVDGQSRPIERYTVVFIPEEPSRDGRLRRPYRIDPWRWLSKAPHRTIFLPGRYSVVAVEPIAPESQALRDPEMITRLKARAIPFTIAAGESKTLQLTLSSY